MILVQDIRVVLNGHQAKDAGFHYDAKHLRVECTKILMTELPERGKYFGWLGWLLSP